MLILRSHLSWLSLLSVTPTRRAVCIHAPAMLTLALCMLCFCTLIGAHASSAAESSTTLTKQLLERRLEVLDEADPDSLKDLYSATLANLTRADAFDAEAEQYLASLESAPRAIEAIQDQLDQAQQAPTPESFEGQPQQALQERLIRARAERRDINSRIEDISTRIAEREGNASNARARLDEIAELLGQFSNTKVNLDPSAAPSRDEADAWLSLSQQAALRAENRAKEAQLQSQPVRYSLLRVQAAELQNAQTQIDAVVQALITGLAATYADPIDLNTLDIRAQDPAYAIAADLAARDQQLYRDLIDTDALLAELRATIKTIQTRTAAIEERRATVERLVEFASQR